MSRIPEGQQGDFSHVSDIVFTPYAITHDITHILFKLSYLGCKTHFYLKSSLLWRYLVSSGLISPVPGEQRHSWPHCSGAGWTACTQTYKTAMKRDIKRPHGFMFLSCGGRHPGPKMLKPWFQLEPSLTQMRWIGSFRKYSKMANITLKLYLHWEKWNFYITYRHFKPRK